MTLVKSLYQMINPQINIKHFKTSEDTEKGKINREFVFFNADNTVIDNVFAARMLAKKMGQKVFPFLNKLSEVTKNEEQLAKILKTKSWVYKKAVWHPAIVEKCTHKVLREMKKSEIFASFPLSYKEIYKDTSIIAILHDIGRLSEVDIAQGTVVTKHNGLNKNHADIGFDILEHAKIKPEILLAIKYHEFIDIEEALNDEIYKKLAPENKKIAEFYVRMLQDMDKAGNLVERAQNGAKKSAEYFNDLYKKDYCLTEEYYKIAMSGKYLPVMEGHLLDVMLHYVTWGYDAHYKETKEILASVLSDIFLRIYEEIWEEYNNSQDKNVTRLVNVLDKIMKLENYAVFERNGMKINERNRKKILKQIHYLKEKSDK
jgi:hypothetical protein